MWIPAKVSEVPQRSKTARNMAALRRCEHQQQLSKGAGCCLFIGRAPVLIYFHNLRTTHLQK
jgi:hypothetical protein